MGKTVKRQKAEDQDGNQLDKIDDTLEKLLEFGDQLAVVSENAMKTVDKKQAAENADSTKKKSSPSSGAAQSDDSGGDSMNVDADTIADGIEKLKDIKGDMKLSEASEWIREHPKMVENAIGDF